MGRASKTRLFFAVAGMRRSLNFLRARMDTEKVEDILQDDEQKEAKSGFMRRIVSFVRREGRLTPGQERALNDNWPIMGIPYEKGMLDFAKVYGSDVPVVFEIGFGMGKSFVEMAAAEPNAGFLGIEVHRPGIGACLMAAAAANLKNVRVMDHDAVEVLENMIPDGSLSRIQIFFPDPWHKKKHHKRRLIQPKFVDLLGKKLKSGGILHLATDWVEYSEWMLEVMNGAAGFCNMADDGTFIPRPVSRPLTKFEERGIRLGHAVRDLMFRKV